MGCRFSSLRKISAGASSTFSRISGVRRAEPAIRSRAARISSSGMLSIGCMTPSSQLDVGSDSLFPSDTVQIGGDDEVLDGDPQRLEERDLLLRPPTGAATEQDFAQLAADVLVSEHSLALRDEEVSGFVQRRLAAVDEQSRAQHGVRIQLACV